MTWIKLRPKIILAFALLALITTSGLTRIQAQPTKPVISKVRFVPPPPIAYRGAPSGRIRGGASRGQCPSVSKPLTALMPANQRIDLKQAPSNSTVDTSEVVWALTSVESPTLWFYVPYSLTPNLPVRFVLQDEAGKDVYPETPLTVSQTSPGVIKFPLPATVTLEVDKRYHWFFLIDCTANDPVYVDGWIQRSELPPTLATQLKQATPRQQVALYAANGFWHDALTTLAELRSAYPEDSMLKDDWVSLLDSVDLNAIAQEPLVQCCTPNRQKQKLVELLSP